MEPGRALLLLLAVLPTQPVCAAEPKASTSRYSLEILDQHGRRLETFEQGGRTYVLGEKGERYQIRVRNHSDRRVEAVVSVDGRDVIDGGPGEWHKRGYLIPAWDEVIIEGFRLNLKNVAAFRFSDVKSSYAAKMGNAREVGVIGVALFDERAPRPPVLTPPRRRWQSGEADSASGPSAPPPASSAAPLEENAAGDEAGTSGRGLAQRESRSESSKRPGLGTAFGERRWSQVNEVYFERAHPRRPVELLALRYNDRDGLVALGLDVDRASAAAARRELWRRETARPFANMNRFSTPPPGWTPYEP